MSFDKFSSSSPLLLHVCPQVCDSCIPYLLSVSSCISVYIRSLPLHALSFVCLQLHVCLQIYEVLTAACTVPCLLAAACLSTRIWGPYRCIHCPLSASSCMSDYKYMRSLQLHACCPLYASSCMCLTCIWHPNSSITVLCLPAAACLSASVWGPYSCIHCHLSASSCMSVYKYMRSL